jgi:superfamily II DNA or RNA helicase
MKSEVQKKAVEAFLNSKERRATIALAVGMGKTKCAIDIINIYRQDNPDCKILFSGARQIYTVNFKDELKIWNCSEANITFTCNKSLKNYNEKFDLIIIDEMHKEQDLILEQCLRLIRINKDASVLGLTGTPSTTHAIHQAFPICYTYLINNAINNSLLNNFKMVIIKYDMTDEERSIYEYHYKNYLLAPRSYNGYPPELSVLKRHLNNLQSKVDLTNQIIKSKFSDKKLLIYAGSIEQGESFGYPQYNSSMEKKFKKTIYDEFYQSTSGKLVNVGILKESVSIPKLKYGFVLGIDSSVSSKEQLIGRFCRIAVHEESFIYFIVAKGTIEEKWVLNGMDKSRDKIINVNINNKKNVQ